MSTHLEETLFHAAREICDPAARESFLVQACGGDGVLRARVEALLRAEPVTSVESEFPAPSVAEPPRPAPLEKAGDTIGRYKLLQQIGVGGCGIVYMAEQSEPVRRRVALKVIKVGMDTKSVIARFEAERQALAMMEHVNIARVLDAGATAAGRPFFVMELVRGIPITNYCDENNLAAPQRLGLFMAVCHAIQHAHQKGIIHRDIKPSNILVTLHDGVPVPKVIDFGIAKATEARLTDLTLFTELHAFIGTPAYTSPEQAEMSGLDIDTRADIYSLGVLLYELLAGRLPFDPKELLKAGLDEMRRTIREVEPPRPSTRLSTLTDAERTAIARHRGLDQGQLSTLLRGDLDWIVMKTLEKDRTRRYDTANGLAHDIQRYLASEPVLARPPSAAYLLRKLVRRRRTAFAAGSAVLLALIAGIGVSSWQAVRATRAELAIEKERTAAVAERDRAREARQEATNAAQEAKDQRQLAEGARAEAEHHLDANLYATSMNLAQAAWEQANIGRLLEILDETSSSPNRGFEWYYWQHKAHMELRTLRGHEAPVRAVVFSPNGQRIVTGGDDKTAKLWNAETGRELLTFKGHTGLVKAIAFSPDGRRIVTGSGDETAKVWDVESGRELLSLSGNTGIIPSVAFSEDGQRIVTGCHNGNAKVWDARTGRELFTLKGEAREVPSVAFSPDGRRIVGETGETAKKVVMVWDSQLESLVGNSVYDLPDPPPVGGAVFSTNSNEYLSRPGRIRLADSPETPRIVSDTGGGDKKAKVWDAKTGREMLTLKGVTGLVSSVAVSPDAKQIVTGGLDGTAKLWDAETGRELCAVGRHGDSVISLATSPNGRLLVTGSSDKTAKVWSVDTGRELLTLEGHAQAISSVAISPDNRRIVTGSLDGTAKVWDSPADHESVVINRLNDSSKPCVVSVAFAPDGRRITARVLDAETCGGLLSQKRNASLLHLGAISADGRRIFGGINDRLAKVWDAETGREIFTLKGITGLVSAMAVSADGRRILIGDHNGTITVWDAKTDQEMRTIKGHSAEVSSVVFTADVRHFVSVGVDGTAKVWDWETGRELLALKGQRGEISALALSPDGRRIITGGYDHRAKIWDGESGQTLFTLEGHTGPVSSVAISTDGRRILTGSHDGTVKIWDAETGRELLTLRPQAEWAISVPFVFDPQRTLRITRYEPASEWAAASSEEVDLKHFEMLIGGRDYAAAFDLANKISDSYLNDADLQNELAWEIVTTSQTGQSGIDVAEKAANRANDATHAKRADILDTLARVLFMRGEKEAAIESQEQAVKLAKDKEKEALVETLESYRKGILPKPE